MPTRASKGETPQFSAIRASLLSALIDRLEASNESAQPILNRIGLSPAQLSDPYGFIPMPQFVAFLEGASASVKDPVLGARIGAGLKAGDMGPLGIVLSLSESIQAGISRFVRYTNALQSGTQSQWIQVDDQWVFSYRLTDSRIWPRRQDAEFSLASLIQVVRDNFGRGWSPQEVHFEHSESEDPAFLVKFFRCPVLFRQPINRLFVRQSDCSAVVRTEDPQLLATLERHVADLISPGKEADSLAQAVTAIIEVNLGLAPVSVERIAQAFGFSPRTLQRKLAREGTTLRHLVETTRRQKAEKMLALPGARVNQVAMALGYGDPTAFWRAYREWTGTPPSQAMPPSGT
jgi:AraC-like DNA-binding protein